MIRSSPLLWEQDELTREGLSSVPREVIYSICQQSERAKSIYVGFHWLTVSLGVDHQNSFPLLFCENCENNGKLPQSDG